MAEVQCWRNMKSASVTGLRSFCIFHSSWMVSTQEGFLEEWAFGPDFKDEDYT